MTENQNEKWGLHWFRRDLRVSGNLALRSNWKRNGGRVLGIFCFDSVFLSRSDFSHNRFAFFLKTLRALKSELSDLGGDLLVIDSIPHTAFAKLIEHFKSERLAPPTTVSWCRDYEPYARKRDTEVEELLNQLGIETLNERDHLMIEPGEIKKDQNSSSFYQVYSPFFRRWHEFLLNPQGLERIKSQSRSLKDGQDAKNASKDVFKMSWAPFSGRPSFPFQDSLEAFEAQNRPYVNIPIPEAGFKSALSSLKTFSERVAKYHSDRDIPSLDATSRLSIYLKNGSLTSAHIIAQLQLEKAIAGGDTGHHHFLKEIAWREFYYSILFHRPDVESGAFLKKFENLRWENSETLFSLWKEGQTGFPIVDAGMRQLAQTGWMHNRVRMIVASFLTKDLLIDWRWGERYFMQALLDGDLAPNNGGWQWAASTGCDPQPYFRIFNPWLQSEKFDPTCKYIKHYIPELQSATAKEIHSPKADLTKYGYAPFCVDHAEQKKKALDMYKAAT